MSGFEHAWTGMTDRAEFPYMPHLLMPKSYWTEESLSILAERVNEWRGVIDNDRNYFGIMVNIDKQGYPATETLFSQALDIAEAATHIIRDREAERERFNTVWDASFPDELYIGRVQIPEMYRSLTIGPAGELVKYAQAMGRIVPAPEAPSLEGLE